MSQTAQCFSQESKHLNKGDRKFEAHVVSSLISAKFSNARLENDDGMRFGLFEDTRPNAKNRKRKRQIVAETDKMTYVGKNYGSYAAAENKFAK